jgi:hypothetical protein
MTPRQIAAYSILAGRRYRMESASQLNLMASAMRAEPKALQEITNSLLKRR